MHVHPGTHETFIVLEGLIEFSVGAEKILAGPGTTVHVPPGTAHAFRYVGPETNMFLAMMTPSIDMETYFTELRELVRESIPPDREKMTVLSITSSGG